jgi:hypothetical protein
MTTHSVSDDSAIASPDSNPPCYADDSQSKTTFLPEPSSLEQEQGDLPNLTSLQVLVSDPATECHACPIQQAFIEAEQAEQGAPQDGHIEAPAVAPSGDNSASNGAADTPASAQRYRPAYELADAAHERLGRGTHPPVLKA